MALLTHAPSNFMQPIRSAIAEALEIGWHDIAPVFIHFRIPLTAATGLAGGKDIYRVEGGYDLLVWEMRAHIALNAITSEALSSVAGSLLGIAGAKNRVAVKAMNARATLKNIDKDGVEIIDTNVTDSTGVTAVTLPLWAIMRTPVKWCEGNDVMPLIVPEGDRLQCDIKLTDVTADATPVTNAGGATEYGVTLIGGLVRSRSTS